MNVSESAVGHEQKCTARLCVPCVCVSNYAVYIETVGCIPVGLVGYEMHGQDDCLEQDKR